MIFETKIMSLNPKILGFQGDSMGKAHAAKPDDLTSIPRTHMVETEPISSHCPLTSTRLMGTCK